MNPDVSHGPWMQGRAGHQWSQRGLSAVGVGQGRLWVYGGGGVSRRPLYLLQLSFALNLKLF